LCLIDRDLAAVNAVACGLPLNYLPCQPTFFLECTILLVQFCSLNTESNLIATMILHVDMDAFYASVELRDDPALIGKPVVVGGSPKGRGVIAAASYEARKYGIFSAMPASKAIRLCPSAIFIKPRMEHYASISKQIREIFFRFTSLVEPLSLDEAFLDVSGSEKLFGEGASIGRQVQAAISKELNLVASVGVAPNKFLAKVASDLDKPNGFVVVEPDRINEFLDPLAISRVWGVGPQTAKKFRSFGVEKIGQLRALPKDTLNRAFGLNADHFWRLARGLDTRPVVPDRVAKTVSHETTFRFDIENDECLEAWLLELTDQVGRRLRRHKIYGKTVQIKVRYGDFQTLTRSKTMALPSQTTHELWVTAQDMLTSVRSENQRGVRLLGMGVSNLSKNRKQQQLLFDQDETEKSNRMDETTDSIRDKFGSSALKRASSIEHNIKYRADPKKT
jgi:DNA polymerase-4